MVLYHGSCHCGLVKWTVDAGDVLEVIECNCSVCQKKQNHHVIVPKEKFRLLQGADKLTTYTFNTHQAQHEFCSVCGVQSFYVPRSNTDGIAFMPHCIDQPLPVKSNKIQCDGQNWEQMMDSQIGNTIKALSSKTENYHSE